MLQKDCCKILTQQAVFVIVCTRKREAIAHKLDELHGANLLVDCRPDFLLQLAVSVQRLAYDVPIRWRFGTAYVRCEIYALTRVY